tara:strand:+ start:5877 stop:6317 length:441 start_codon:yes stop_codon:yes gene_type:complete
MRHKLGYKKLNRTSEHRKALIKNMLNSLIKYEQIITTLPKAKLIKPQAEKLITLGKKKNLTNTRVLISKLQDKTNANKILNTLSKRYEKRAGGYTRIVKAGYRYGDNSPMAVIEFVDRDVEAKRKFKKKKKEDLKTEDKNKKQIPA